VVVNKVIENMLNNNMMLQLPQYIIDKINLDKFEIVKDNNYLIEEVVLLKHKIFNKYYEHIILNIDINKTNPNNSYIMWIVDKVDNIDITKPCIIHKANISLGDIDIDLEKAARDHVIQYLKNTYGHDHVSQMITYQTMKGRGALKDVLRTYGIINFEEMNRITKLIPDEAKISGELQKMKEESGESSIILYALENERDARKDTTKKNKHIKNKETLEEWCYLDDDNNLRGPLGKHFEQAIRLEKTKTSQSKHAAGIAISPKPLQEICPMIYDPKENTVVAGLEMNDLEKIGVVKLDLLGIAMLDKIMGVKEILAYGDICDDTK